MYRPRRFFVTETLLITRNTFQAWLPQLHTLRDVKIADVATRVQRFLRRWCKTAKVKLVDVCFTSVGLLLGLIFWVIHV